MTRHGLPAAMTPLGTSRVTTLPAPITVLSPIVTPGKMIAPPPIQQSDADANGLAIFALAALGGVERVRGSVDLHRRSEPRERADAHLAHVEHDAVEVEVDAFSQVHVRAVVAEERRLHPHAVASAAEKLLEEVAAQRLVRLLAGVEGPAKVARFFAAPDQLWIHRVVQFSGQHFLELGFHELRCTTTQEGFTPRRILEQTIWTDRRDESPGLVHPRVLQHSARNLHRRVADFSDSLVAIWFSSRTEDNRQGCVMQYTSRSEKLEAWYASMRLKDQVWRVHLTKGIERERVEALIEDDNVPPSGAKSRRK